MRSLSVLLGIGAVLFFGLAAFSDGIIIPVPPLGVPPPVETPWLTILYHHVTVRIEGGVVVTHVDQEFRNDHSFPVEGTYVFPLPPGAVVQEFVLWVDGQPVEGEVLPADQARSSTWITCGATRIPLSWNTWAGTPSRRGCSPFRPAGPGG